MHLLWKFSFSTVTNSNSSCYKQVTHNSLLHKKPVALLRYNLTWWYLPVIPFSISKNNNTVQEKNGMKTKHAVCNKMNIAEILYNLLSSLCLSFRMAQESSMYKKWTEVNWWNVIKTKKKTTRKMQNIYNRKKKNVNLQNISFYFFFSFPLKISEFFFFSYIYIDIFSLNYLGTTRWYGGHIAIHASHYRNSKKVQLNIRTN